MRIAVLDSFPNLENKAELEFMARFHIAARNLGIESKTVVTSDDVIDYEPDLVLSTHEFSRKLTGFPTIGLIWSPLSFFEKDIYRLKSLMSYDGYLVGNEQTRRFLKDLGSGVGIDKPIGDRLFLPTACKSPEKAFPRSSPATLGYIGVHWDGDRHHDLLTALSDRNLIKFYGPSASWTAYPDAYVSALPFDGVSVQQTIASHGIALCLHKQEHRLENMPSMRIFEALSVGALVICDKLPFAVEHLSDIAFFLNLDVDDAATTAERIAEIVDWINANPSEAADRAARGRAWFESGWSLEHNIEHDLIPLYQDVLDRGRFRLSPASRGKNDGPTAWLKRRFQKKRTPEIEVVIRAGGRPLDYVDRAVASVRAANDATVPLAVTLVDYAGRSDIESFCTRQSTDDLPIRYLRSPANGFRSTTLWTGLLASTAPFVSHMDDDDTVFPNHYRQLHATLARFAHVNMAYSGVLRFEEDSTFVSAPNFVGHLDRIISERRNLEFLESFDLTKLARFDNYIQSNAWLARRDFLKSILGDDPQLVVVEDVYLYLLAASRGPFAFTGSATAVWHWRGLDHENSMKAVDQTIWADSGRRIRALLRNIPFAPSLSVSAVARLGREDVASSPGATFSLPAMSEGVELLGGMEIGEGLALWGFHGMESGGVWTAAQTARADINPSRAFRRSGGAVILTFMPAPALEPGYKWFEVELEGGECVRRSYKDTADQVVVLPLPARHTGYYRLFLRVSELLPGGQLSQDERDLGIYLKSVRFEGPRD